MKPCLSVSLCPKLGKKEYITDSTFECIKEGRALSKSLYRISRQLARLLVRVLFAEWKKFKNIHEVAEVCPLFPEGQGQGLTVAGSDGTDCTRPCTLRNIHDVSAACPLFF